MVSATNVTKGSQVENAECNHFWSIQNVGGRISVGICKNCGMRKEFKNYLPDCLKTSEEQYEQWLSKQKDHAKSGKAREGATSRTRERHV